jgi:hypothetical protein
LEDEKLGEPQTVLERVKVIHVGGDIVTSDFRVIDSFSHQTP